jgi:predicted dehydrogenase
MARKRYRVGVVGFAHMHVNHVLALFAQHPQVELAAGADTVPEVPELRKAPYTRAWNLEHARRQLGLPRVYERFEEMLDRERLDLAIVTCENARHAEVVAACAARGTGVCVEKPMAATLDEALAMARAVRASGTAMAVNWPMAWDSGARACAGLAAAGAVGRVLEVRTRLGSTGPLGQGVRHAGVAEAAEPLTPAELGAVWWHSRRAGGGAMLDYCCYGAMFARWVIGEPAVSAVGMRANLASPWGDADDNAAMIVRFPAALAVLEATWTTRDHGAPTGPIVYGSEGTLVVERQGERRVVREARGGGEGRVHEAPPLPAGRSTIAEELIHHLDTGEPMHQCLEAAFNLEAMAILDAGIRSAESGKREAVTAIDPALAQGPG